MPRQDYVQKQYYDKHLRHTAAANGTEDRTYILFQYHTKRIMAMAMNRFKWLGLPKTVDIRFLELSLFRSALAVFYYDWDVERFFVAQGVASSSRDMFDNPRSFRVIGNQYVPTKTLPKDMCVPIWANFARVPDHDLVLLWAARITEFETTFDVNAKNARRPRVLVYDENTRLSASNINDQIDKGVPTIEVGSDVVTGGMLQSFDLGIHPDMLEKLHITRMRLENQMMGELGINNANQDKKERLVSDEVDANNDQVAVARSVNLAARKFAALQINDRYGLNVEVEYGSDVMAEHSSMVDANPPADDVPENWPGTAKPKPKEDAS